MKVTLKTQCENTAGVTGVQAEWGWSILVETGHERVLVDADAEGRGA